MAEEASVVVCRLIFLLTVVDICGNNEDLMSWQPCSHDRGRSHAAVRKVISVDSGRHMWKKHGFVVMTTMCVCVCVCVCVVKAGQCVILCTNKNICCYIHTLIRIYTLLSLQLHVHTHGLQSHSTGTFCL